ncbi:MAG: hypothetical protein U1D41_14600 [Nitrosomonas sp.]|uniref:hypothetical protein n=1 Tax=Nitrosomonas sp. TaxID=42353 RepID=UPI0027629D34|nr:hypothetical protein [Nitrosomonas sp.]MDP3609454.1 hypothetical protein [Methylophilus sp.]MDZ4107357.1 hypothetical protein [Nitrosomonas sp.]
METPINALVADMVEILDDCLREDFEERSAIMEYDAELPRAHAECLALLDVLRRHPSMLYGVTVLRAVLNDSDLWLLTTDIDRTRQHVAEIGAIEIGVSDLKDVIDQQFSGITALASIK